MSHPPTGRRTPGGFIVILNTDDSESVFAAPDRLSDLEWDLRYGSVDRSATLKAASVISAYRYLLTEATRDRMCEVRRKVRLAMETP